MIQITKSELAAILNMAISYELQRDKRRHATYGHGDSYKESDFIVRMRSWHHAVQQGEPVVFIERHKVS